MTLSEQLKKQAEKYADRMISIDFQVDTLANTTSRAGGYYLRSNNTLTLNYHEDDEDMLAWEQSSRDVILYHEQKHRSNAERGFKSYDINVSPEQYYKLCMADEISANMAELVYLREEYIRTGDISVFDKDGGKFAFYKEAVQKGEVNPLSSDPKDFDKDMSLIMNGTQQMWVENFSEGSYDRTHRSMVEYYLAKHQGPVSENDETYLQQLDIAYTIGGVNFRKYMQKDAEVPSFTQQVLKTQNEDQQWLARQENLRTYKDNMSLEQYNNLLQHVYIANKIKESTWFTQENIKNLSPEELKHYKATVNAYVKTAMKELQNEKTAASIQCRVENVVGAKGERAFVPSANDKNYQEALRQVYQINGIDYSSLLEIDPNQKMPVEKTSYVKDFEQKNVFVRCMTKFGRWEVKAFNSVKNACVKGWNKLRGKNEKTIQVKPGKNYRKWSKDSRVSDVQYVTILDLNKDIIKKPVQTKSAVQEQQPQKPADKGKSSQPKTADFKIAYSQISESYGMEHLKGLCSNKSRWNAGRSCDAEKYSKAAQLTGLPAELIAYAYEVNRKNFPSQAAEAEKVVNSSRLSDLEIAKSVAGVLAKYDIERGSFFALRETPKEISFSRGIAAKIKDLSSRQRNGTGQCMAMTIRRLRGQEQGVSQVANNILMMKEKQRSYA